MNDTAQRELELEENALKQIAQAGFNVDAVQAYRDNCGVSYTPLYSVNTDGEVIEEWQDWIGNFEEAFQGEMSTEDFAVELANDCYLSGKDVPQWVVNYFDYEKFERDLFLGDYWEQSGFIFRSL